MTEIVPRYPAFFLIQTAQDTYLCIERTTGRLRHSNQLNVAEYTPLLFAHVGPAATDGFLVSWAAERGMRFLDDYPILELAHPGAADAIFADQDETEFRVYPVLVHRLSNSAAVAFQDPIRMLFLSVEPPDPENAHGRLGFRKDTAGESEHFRLHSFQWRPSADFCAMVSQISRLLRGSMALDECAALIAQSHSALEQETWLAICFRTFRFPDFIRLLAALRQLSNVSSADKASGGRGVSGLAMTLMNCMRPQDKAAGATNGLSGAHAEPAGLESNFWTTYALPGLRRWAANRRWSGATNNQALVDTDLDFLQSWKQEIPFKPSGRLANFIGRYCVEPTKDVCVITTARNEGPYLLEWIAHHRAIGVQNFFIYSNDNDGGSEALLERLSEAGEIYYLKNIVKRGVSPQYKAYKHALSVLPDVLDYRWALIVDVDEYLVIDPSRFTTLLEFLVPFDEEEVDAICFNWALFGSSGQAKRTSAFVRQRFVYRAPQLHPAIKCAVRPNRFQTSHAHFPFTFRTLPLDVRHSSGIPHLNFFMPNNQAAFIEPPAEGGAWINHYHCKSAEEYLWTRARGTGDWPLGTDIMTDALLAQFVAQHTSSTVGLRDERIVHCAPSFDYHYQKLMAIPGVADIMCNINRAFQERVSELKQELSNKVVLGDGQEGLRAFLRILQDAG